nr:carotenoid biosynthesis protein [Nocardia shimofusensis]
MLFTVLLVLTQIGYPLTSGSARDQVTIAVVLLSAATALAHATVTRGFRYAAGVLVIISGLGLSSEILGVATGLPYGCYEYALGPLGPSFAEVPLLIPLAWTGGLYPVWVVATLLTERAGAMRAPARIALTMAGALGWDLFLDPQMVADDRWTWCDTDSGLPGIPEIPLTNYLGWLVVALIMALVLTIWEQAAPPPSQRRSGVDDTVPVVVFLWTWLGSALAHLAFLGLPVSAGYGFAGMGVLGVPLLVRLVRHGFASVVRPGG